MDILIEDLRSEVSGDERTLNASQMCVVCLSSFSFGELSVVTCGPGWTAHPGASPHPTFTVRVGMGCRSVSSGMDLRPREDQTLLGDFSHDGISSTSLPSQLMSWKDHVAACDPLCWLHGETCVQKKKVRPACKDKKIKQWKEPKRIQITILNPRI